MYWAKITQSGAYIFTWRRCSMLLTFLLPKKGAQLPLAVAARYPELHNVSFQVFEFVCKYRNSSNETVSVRTNF